MSAWYEGRITAATTKPGRGSQGVTDDQQGRREPNAPRSLRSTLPNRPEHWTIPCRERMFVQVSRGACERSLRILPALWPKPLTFTSNGRHKRRRDRLLVVGVRLMAQIRSDIEGLPLPRGTFGLSGDRAGSGRSSPVGKAARSARESASAGESSRAVGTRRREGDHGHRIGRAAARLA